MHYTFTCICVTCSWSLWMYHFTVHLKYNVKVWFWRTQNTKLQVLYTLLAVIVFLCSLFCLNIFSFNICWHIYTHTHTHLLSAFIFRIVKHYLMHSYQPKWEIARYAMKQSGRKPTSLVLVAVIEEIWKMGLSSSISLSSLFHYKICLKMKLVCSGSWSRSDIFNWK